MFVVALLDTLPGRALQAVHIALSRQRSSIFEYARETFEACTTRSAKLLSPAPRLPKAPRCVGHRASVVAARPSVRLLDESVGKCRQPSMPPASARLSTEEEDFTQFLDDGASPSDIWPVVAERIWRLPNGRKR